MRLRFTPEQEAFRQEVRAFLAEHLAEERADHSVEGFGGWSPRFSKKLAARGWIALPWPKQYGGAGLGHMEQMIFNEEMAYHRAPIGAHRRGVFYAGPILMNHGTEEQKARFLSMITRGEGYFCQGFSEPNSGSDLASLQSTAVEDSDEFVLNGTKIWTSDAHRADYCWLAARTNPSAPKHRGISMFILDMHSPGITVQALPNMAGYHSFNQVFFDTVRIPRENLIGEKDRGWYLSAETLDFERSSIANFAGIRRGLEELVQRSAGKPLPSPLRRQVADLWTAMSVGYMMAYHVASMQERGQVGNKEASVVKLFSSELSQRLAACELQVQGLGGQAGQGDWKGRPAGGSYLSSVAATIGGGTSEIQRNVIATRGLGLPRA